MQRRAPFRFYTQSSDGHHLLVFVEGVDETVVVTLKYPGSRLAVFTCSAGVQLPNEAVIAGTKGTIKVGQ